MKTELEVFLKAACGLIVLALFFVALATLSGCAASMDYRVQHNSLRQQGVEDTIERFEEKLANRREQLIELERREAKLRALRESQGNTKRLRGAR